MVDPGRFTYADSPVRRWFKGSAAHNTVTVDELDQTPYPRVKPNGHQSQRGSSADPRHDIDAIDAEVRAPSTRSCTPVVSCSRSEEYWVIHDHLRA